MVKIDEKNVHRFFRFRINCIFAAHLLKTWYHGRVVRQRSAKPCTAVRLCLVPPQAHYCKMMRFSYLFLPSLAYLNNLIL